ncbi:MAG: tRNA (adenosine(37)-N6)-dimethylallyltransferase MiaA [Bacillaceae bacterium G1]|nr:MAG: tRNA (adenosine(37)-N6)-dimethylallyltransferase MiaA [Bacillaceae bacterium G1]
MKKPLLVIVGPTAVGKTDLSIHLARQFDMEIVSADSMQVYIGMDIGTAKVSPEIRREIPHHLIDICYPDEPYSVAQFQRDAVRAIEDIHGRQKVPLMVGGTGLYVRSVTHGYLFSDAPKDETLRNKWKAFYQTHGPQALYAQLAARDPETAQRLHHNDVKRIIRALEVQELTGVPFSRWRQQQAEQQPWYDVLTIGLWMERSLLYERINRRVDRMLEQGLVEEVAGLLAKGYDESLPSMQGLGYKEIIAYLKGRWTLEQAVAELKKRTRRFAKRQYTWFRRQHDVHWFEVGEEGWMANFPEIQQLVAGKFYATDEYT